MWQATGGEVKHYIYMQQINDKIRVAMIKKEKKKAELYPNVERQLSQKLWYHSHFHCCGEKKNLIIKSRYNPITDLHKTMFILTGDVIVWEGKARSF